MKNILKVIVGASAGLLIASAGVQAGSKKVRIFVPTPNPVKAVKKPQVDPVTSGSQVIVHRVYFVPYYTRGQRLKLFVGPRYPGFNKQYRGPKYPF